jgi:hypothetical protein
MKFAAVALMFVLVSLLPISRSSSIVWMLKKLVCVLVAVMALGGCKEGKPVGASCVKSDECESNVCWTGIGPKTCRCASNADCQTGLVCSKTVDTGPTCDGPPTDAGIEAL